MLQTDKKMCFIELGNFLRQFSVQKNIIDSSVINNDHFYNRFIDLIHLSQSHNGWFTHENVYFAIQSWAEALKSENLEKWLKPYDFTKISPKTIGLILAGNIPLVGFHDFLSVLISGHRVVIKTSSNDQHLIQFLASYLINLDSDFEDCIVFTDGKLENFEAVIATGSNNTARYFEYYFRSVPHIIRKNRNSVAVLTGDESLEDLINLGEDIFRYFGLGCRNVSKLFVPNNYDFQLFFQAMYAYKDIIFYDKYANNYDYNKAVFLMSNFKILDNEFMTLKEDTSYSSPISSLFFEYYEDFTQLEEKLSENKDKIQCIVSNGCVSNSIPFGKTQKPELWDYADGVDTLAFLERL